MVFFLVFCLFVFFFKQKAAYEIRLGLVGSEMCIRASQTPAARAPRVMTRGARFPNARGARIALSLIHIRRCRRIERGRSRWSPYY